MTRRTLLQVLSALLSAPLTLLVGGGGRTERMVRRAIKHLEQCPSVAIIAPDYGEAGRIMEIAREMLGERFMPSRLTHKPFTVVVKTGSGARRLRAISARSRSYKGFRADVFIDHSVFERMPANEVNDMLESLKHCGEVYV